MTDREQYTPGPANGEQVRKDGETWTLILIRNLRHSPEKVWPALTDPTHLHEWAPFEADVKQADAPKVLEYNDLRWELGTLE